MARIAREYSETGIYHVFFRGINRQHIFEESADYTKFLDVLETLHNELNVKIYAYCLMSNHVHLIIKEQNIGDISRFMSRLLTVNRDVPYLSRFSFAPQQFAVRTPPNCHAQGVTIKKRPRSFVFLDSVIIW